MLNVHSSGMRGTFRASVQTRGMFSVCHIFLSSRHCGVVSLLSKPFVCSSSSCFRLPWVIFFLSCFSAVLLHCVGFSLINSPWRSSKQFQEMLLGECWEEMDFLISSDIYWRIFLRNIQTILCFLMCFYNTVCIVTLPKGGTILFYAN